MDKSMLASYGIDYNKGLTNCMGKEVFYKKILSMFLQDKSISQSKIAFASKDARKLFSCLHELKGISGNSGLIEIFKVSTPIVEAVRNCGDNFPDIKDSFEQLLEVYEHTCEGIRLFVKE